MRCFIHRIATDYVLVAIFSLLQLWESKGSKFHVGSNEDETEPTGKMIKHLTSTRLLKTFGRAESFMIAFNHLPYSKKYIEKKRLPDNFQYYQHVLDTKKRMPEQLQ